MPTPPITTGSNITNLPTSQLQSALGITSDNIYGSQTTTAVRAFQTAHGLTADGVFGPQTLAAYTAQFGGGSHGTPPPPATTIPTVPVASTGAPTPAPVQTPASPAPAQDPNDPANTGAPSPVPTATPAAPANSAGAPTPAPIVPASAAHTPTLQIGSKGQDVSTLQALLGVKTDGEFGAKTQAAVKAFQAANGLVVDGIVGQKTLDALNKSKSGPTPDKNVTDGMNSNADNNTTDPNADPNAPAKKSITGDPKIDAIIEAFNNQSPQKSFTDVYKEVYTSLGLDTMKADYEKQTKEFTDLQEEKNKEKDDINNNPWLSEGVRVGRLKELDSKYEGRELILTNKLKLLESNITNGRADAQFVAGQTMDQLQQSAKLNSDLILKAIDIAEKQAEAEGKLSGPTSVQEYEYAVKQGYKGSYTQYQNEDANRKAKANGSSPIYTTDENGNIIQVGNYDALTIGRYNKAVNAATSVLQKNPTFKNIIGSSAYLDRIEAAVKNPGSIGDQELLDAFTQLNTGGNRVTEAQVKLITGSKSFADKFNTWTNKLKTGGSLSNQQRQEIVNLSQEVYKNYQKSYLPLYNDAVNRLKAQGIPKEFWNLPSPDTLSRAVNDGSSSVSSSTPSKFDYLQKDLSINGKNAYLPRRVWDTVKGADKDALLAEIRNDGYTLLLN